MGIVKYLITESCSGNGFCFGVKESWNNVTLFYMKNQIYSQQETTKVSLIQI